MACAARLGIERSSHVVVYDTAGVFSAPRTAFTFKVRSLSPSSRSCADLAPGFRSCQVRSPYPARNAS